MTSRRRGWRALPVLLGLALLGTGCGPFGSDGAGPEKAADKLAAALQKGDVSAVTFSDSSVTAKEYTDLAAPLKDFHTVVTVDKVTRSGDDANVRLAWKQTLGGIVWKHSTKATLRERDGVWTTNWVPSVLATGLDRDDALRVTTIKAQRGNILGANDQPIVVPRPVVRFGIDKAQVPAAAAADSARRLAILVGVAPAPFAQQVAKAGPKAFVQAIVLRRTDVPDRMLAGLAGIKGARGISDRLPLAPTKDFAAAILGTVGPVTAELIERSKGRLRVGDDTGLSGLELRYDEQLFGTSGVKVTAVAATVDATHEPKTLFEADPITGKDLHTTLDPRLETKAQDLLAGIGPASALVAIRPSTGQVLAAASGPGSKGYNTATFGRYAPGSTFKVVSSLALLRSGLTPESSVTCPATVSVNGKRFKNYSDYPADRLGRITLRDAVANSCNTAFISSRARIRGTALADAAAALGFGVDHDLGFPAYFGQVLAPASETEAAADLIGQGKVLASPFAMAAIAASVAAGKTVLPSLLPDVDPGPVAPSKPLTAAEAEQLRGLMHAVVQEGSGSFLQALEPPQVLAKTGTAEYGTTAPLLTHAWMIGVRGDLAVAVFVDTGQSGSRTAGPILEAFLRAADR